MVDRFRKSLFAVILAGFMLLPAYASAEYVAATWSDNMVHLLDNSLNNVSSFSLGSTSPNGIATNGTLIYVGFFSTQEVIAYDFSGVEQFRWSGTLNGLQGMELVNGDLAIYQNSTVEFHNPTTGALLRTIPGQTSIEGLAYDGTNLWQLDDSLIYAANPADGAVIRSIPNAAASCSYGGTGMTSSGPNELTLACDDGTWYRVSTVDGSVISTGSNGLSMYGLKYYTLAPAPAPAPVPTMSEWGLVAFMILAGAAAVYALRRRSAGI
ncbi:MAG: IPTL-CTERM sorting domain-containing protein [Nitrospiraceae bacterium]|nr:IPTL-CTERM sorting domain-containing protein [Nitrospiraceae bacterium]